MAKQFTRRVTPRITNRTRHLEMVIAVESLYRRSKATEEELVLGRGLVRTNLEGKDFTFHEMRLIEMWVDLKLLVEKTDFNITGRREDLAVSSETGRIWTVNSSVNTKLEAMVKCMGFRRKDW